MKALDVGFVLRKAGASSTTYLDVTREGDLWSWKYKIAFKSGQVDFRLGEEVDEVTPDGRKVKSTVTVEGDKLVWIQRGKPYDCTITRHVEEDGNVMKEVCVAKDVTCNREYKKTP